VEKVSGKVPGTDWEMHTVVESRMANEAALYNENSRTLIVADALGTAKHLRGRGEELGMNPLYRLNPPRKLLEFEPERIFCGHGGGITENATVNMRETIRRGRRKAPSAYFNAFYQMFK
jgi:glyoxylase-like metal-dependent hydrolase (beta-lactamase superfamily II)